MTIYNKVKKDYSCYSGWVSDIGKLVLACGAVGRVAMCAGMLWAMCIARKIGKVNSFLAELWAIRDGPLVTVSRDECDALIIELDAKALVDAFINPNYSNTVVSGPFDDCRQLVTCLP